MDVLILSGPDVRELLPMRECIDEMSAALSTLARGDGVLPLRSSVWMPDRSGLLGLMPAYLGSPRSLGLKALTVMPGNHGTELDSHQGIVLLFDTKRGYPTAILDASSITEIRTAAVSGVATRVLARESAGDLAILGSGVQARSHLAAMREVRTLRRIRVWSKHPESARAFARREGRRHGQDVETCPTARDAVEGADLICTTTASREPILEGSWLSPGAHINAVGACFPTARELDSETVRRSRLYVDRLESARNEAGDLLMAEAEGAFGDDHVVGELGDLLLDRVVGRTSDEEITLFKSLGLAVEDLAAAHHVLQKAIASGRGAKIDLGGERRA